MDQALRNFKFTYQTEEKPPIMEIKKQSPKDKNQWVTEGKWRQYVKQVDMISAACNASDESLSKMSENVSWI